MGHKMKLVGLLALAVSGLLVGCGDKGNQAARRPAGPADTTKLGQLERQLAEMSVDSLSYAVGYVQSKQLRELEFRISGESMLRGLQDGLDGKSKMSDETVRELLNRYVQLYSAVKKERNARRSEEWLDSVSRLEGMRRAESGLVYRVVKEGEGKAATDSSRVLLHIAVIDMHGTELESTYGGEPIEIRLNGNGLKCWDEGLQKIREGGKVELYSPASLAYGEYGGDGIEPNSAMRFDLELVQVLAKK